MRCQVPSRENMAFIGFSKNKYIEYNQLTEKYSWPTISLHVTMYSNTSRRMTKCKRDFSLSYTHECNELCTVDASHMDNTVYIYTHTHLYKFSHTYLLLNISVSQYCHFYKKTISVLHSCKNQNMIHL